MERQARYQGEPDGHGLPSLGWAGTQFRYCRSQLTSGQRGWRLLIRSGWLSASALGAVLVRIFAWGAGGRRRRGCRGCDLWRVTEYEIADGTACAFHASTRSAYGPAP